MATNKPLTPEEAVDMGRRAVGRRALMRTLRDIFSYRNPLLQFMDAYRFNVIRWSASNLREPTLGKRVRLFLGTRNPLRILRDNFRQNRAGPDSGLGKGGHRPYQPLAGRAGEHPAAFQAP
ncbi:hypothetical protein NXX37_09070 [Parabacteroides distasonis]|nr:hypothetical protein NXX37_09070 [Parabacteroides distasonis]